VRQRFEALVAYHRAVGRSIIGARHRSKIEVPVVDAANIDQADFAMRNWQGPEPGPFRTGSDAHKRLFCRMLLETHNPYRPAAIAWPELTQDALRRLTSLPIWDMAVHKEACATLRVRTFAQGVADPLVRQALDLDASEEARHRIVLTRLMQAYGISLAPERANPPPEDPEWAWLATGFSECIDSFFAFGLFEVARRSGFFPPKLIDAFEPVIQEECRHILFFANWVAWYQRNIAWWQRPWFIFKTWRVWRHLVWERAAMAKGIGAKRKGRDANFTMTGSASVGVEVKPHQLIDLCLAENERRMAGYDSRLLRPTTVPRLARLVQRLMPAA
jgi:hypothetical protein